MKKVAIFGKPGSGKSTFSQKLADVLSIPLHYLDLIEYDPNGGKLCKELFIKKHEELLAQPSWIIDGLGTAETFKQRLDEADTLVYIDLPYWTCYWLVTKRLLKGIFTRPKGWPKDCSIIKGSINSYKYLRLSPHFWNANFSQKIQNYTNEKQVYVLTSLKEVNEFTDKLTKE